VGAFDFAAPALALPALGPPAQRSDPPLVRSSRVTGGAAPLSGPTFLTVTAYPLPPPSETRRGEEAGSPGRMVSSEER